LLPSDWAARIWRESTSRDGLPAITSPTTTPERERMNFLRYKSSRVGVGTSNHIRAQMPWSALTTAIATMSLFVCQSFAQKSFTEPSRALTAIDISQYLIARESKPVELGPKESSSVSADAIVEKMTGASARRASE